MTTSRSFTLLCTVGVFCFISYNMVRMPVLALFAESLGASPERIGLIVSVSTLTGVFLKLPSGALSDIYGRRFLLRIGVVAFGLPPFLYPWVTDLDTLTALRFFHGLATAIFAPSALATVADLYRERRGAALGTYTASTQSGALLGPFIGGYLIYVSGFSSAFVTAGLFGCIAIAIFYSLHLTPLPPRIQEKGMAPLLAEMWKGFRVVAKNRKVLITSSTDAAKMIANGALMAFLPLYGVSVGLNPGEVGLLFTVQALTSLVSKPIMGRVSDRIGRQPLIISGLVICAATFVCIPQVSMLWSVIGAFCRVRIRRSRRFLFFVCAGRRQFRVQGDRGWNGYARNDRRHRPCRRPASGRDSNRASELCQCLCHHRRSATYRGGGILDDDETGVASVGYNGLVMNAIATENIVIGVLASIGVLVLLVMVVYVVRQMFSQKGE